MLVWVSPSVAWVRTVVHGAMLRRYPPFVSNSVRSALHSLIRTDELPVHPFQRHVTRQKILNWKQTLKFPPHPHVSHEGVNLMQQLLCEPEDRLGSQTTASVFRPDVLAVRRSGFMLPASPAGGGAELVKVRGPLRLRDVSLLTAPLYRPILGSKG